MKTTYSGSIPVNQAVIDGSRPTLWSFVKQQDASRVPVNIADGASHPLSDYYDTLEAAKEDYPHAVALSDELAWACLQAAVNGLPEGGTLEIPPARPAYSINRPISVSRSISIRGSGRVAVYQTSAETPAISVTASNVVIDGLKLVGVQCSAQSDAESAISCSGSSANDPISGICIINCELRTWGMDGVYVKWARDVDIRQNVIEHCYYSGIRLLSCSGGSVYLNTIRYIAGTPNAYGVTLTRAATGDESADPCCEDFVVAGNVVISVTNWTGLDTHSGRRITFSGNTISGCTFGIAANASTDPVNYVFAPRAISITGNTINSMVSDGSKRTGISFSGAEGTGQTTSDPATGTISGNVIIGHGEEGNSGAGALLLQFTSGVIVSGNTIIEPSPCGIVPYIENHEINISGNVIVDPWSDITNAVAIRLVGGGNSGHIGDNCFGRNSKVASDVLSVGIKIANSTGNSVSVGSNRTSATTYIEDAGGKSEWKLRTKTLLSGAMLMYDPVDMTVAKAIGPTSFGDTPSWGEQIIVSDVTGQRYASFGSAYSSAGAMMAYNAYQTRGSDEWNQNNSNRPSWLLVMENDPDRMSAYRAPALTPTGNRASFWGDPQWFIDTNGNVTVSALAGEGERSLSADGNGTIIPSTVNYILYGSGSPEGVVVASPGTQYIQTDGSENSVLWVKCSGSSNTGWRNRGDFGGSIEIFGDVKATGPAGVAVTMSYSGLVGTGSFGISPGGTGTAVTLSSAKLNSGSGSRLVMTTQTDAYMMTGQLDLSTMGGEQFGGTLPLSYGGTGATSATGARTSLGLGTAATKNVGTGSTEVAVGDHGHTASQISDFATAVNALIAAASFTASQISDWNSATSNFILDGAAFSGTISGSADPSTHVVTGTCGGTL